MDQVAAFRRFTRFYTRQIELLNEGLLKSSFTLAESRVLYEIAERAEPRAGDLARDLGLDAGYLSRILRRFEADGLLRRSPARDDARASELHLTEAGRSAFAVLDRASAEQVGAMLRPLSDAARQRLLGAMAEIEAALGPRPPAEPPFQLRPPRVGDIGWIVHRQGALYAEEYGWDATFEALVAEIVAGFVTRFDPARERCWIAERHGEVVGSVFLVRASDEVAKLRLLYVEPRGRGLGVGRALVAECIGFARACGYRTLTLWTNDVLHAARRIYGEFGFRLVAEEGHRSFGHDLVGQTWELPLGDGASG